MLGRGVKQKQSYNEAEGLKVYLPEKAEVQAQGGSSYLPHLQQQQLVLSLCLDKLQRSRTGVELSLHRSVLLVNTLRQIQQDIQRDLPGSLDLSAQSLSPHPDAPTHTIDLSDLPLNAVHHDSLRDDIWEDGPLTCPGCAEGNRLGVSSPSPPHPSLPTSPSQDSSSGHPRAQSPSAHLRSFEGEMANSLGYLTDLALDDIFEDIDTSMYDSSDIPSALASYPSWVCGVSSWGDEGLKMCSSYTSASTLQQCLTDLNDLDHIMEILVNS